ncbi:MAG TPA: phage tail protein [Candidatus Binatia bacterium]
MMTASQLPPIPRPPHDPTSLLLNWRTGWRAAELQQLSAERSLLMAPAPETQRSLTEISGSFGGLMAPANVACGPDSGVYLLDAETAQLKRFDPCACRFTQVPCFGGTGSGPRQLKSPHGIAICAGNLFVCDTGNHRLSVFALHGFVLRGFWQPPPAAYKGSHPTLANLWEPFDVTFDGVGRAYVTDGANGCIHRFTAAGQWENCFTGFGQATWIAIDCRDRSYVIVAGSPAQVVRSDPDGNRIAIDSMPGELMSLFPRNSISVDAAGLLHLGAFCAGDAPMNCQNPQPTLKCPRGQTPERGVFDLRGNTVDCFVSTPASYVTQATYISAALDSEFYRCQWHRIILRGEIPAGSRVTVSTYTAEAELADDDIENLGEVWQTNQTATEMNKGDWDCLVRSSGGRFLWLRLEFRGNGRVTPRLDSVELEFPRISLRRYLPGVFGREAVSADFTDRFLSLFDTTFRSIEANLDRGARYFDPLSAPAERDPKTGADFLSWLGSWIGLILDRHWPEARRRKFLKHAGRLYDLRGTREGLWRELLLFLDLDRDECCRADQPSDRCQARPANCAPPKPSECGWRPPPLILEHFKLRRWLFLGAGRLGDQAVLWGKRIVNRTQLDDTARVERTQLLTAQDPLRDPFHVYAYKFSVFVPACFRASNTEAKALENILRNGRPAGTQAQLEYVEPRFRIGFQSMIGFDSVVGRYPSGVTLNEMQLGRATVLTAPPHKQGAPSLTVGEQSRIGTTTRLE